MSRLVVKFGAAPDDKTGDSARTGAQKINSNFLELYSFLSGAANADFLPAAIPVNRGGTGATTASGARQALGLGDAATRDVGANENDVMVVGNCGFGTDLSPLVLEVERNKPADFKSGELSYHSIDDVSAITLATRTGTNKAQIGVKGLVSSGQKELVFRVPRDDASFAEWVKMYHSANAVETVNGNIKAAQNAARLTNESCITQKGVALEHSRLSTGKYRILNCVLANSRWVKEVPLDANGLPMFAAKLEQLGTALEVTISKDGANMDIPNDVWVDLHLIA